MNTQVATRMLAPVTDREIMLSEQFLREMDERTERKREVDQRMNCLLEAFRL